MNSRFEQLLLPHLDAAYNLARWLMRSDHDAADVVQEAYLRAFRAFDQFRAAADARGWLLSIVRNACFTALRSRRCHIDAACVQDEIEDRSADPVATIERRDLDEALRSAIEQLPLPFREVFVMHELEGLRYREIAAVIDAPIGTVMSRLARARQRLQELLAPHLETSTKGAGPDGM